LPLLPFQCGAFAYRSAVASKTTLSRDMNVCTNLRQHHWHGRGDGAVSVADRTRRRRQWATGMAEYGRLLHATFHSPGSSPWTWC